ncbi:hypothetical protein [Pseudorhodobacter sp.]|uniref:hypothetical protein n=1 Tax=Pseudorhodobacter sp. TaxID=1934400 RepID=UPI002649615A|nr:hypothetical protein [Pseudorhodobacter sp.]
MLRAVAFALLVAAPAAAQDREMLGAQLSQLASGGPEVLQAAYAACILGGGTVDGAVALFADHGWTRMDDVEMSSTELRSTATEVVVTLYDEGRICAVVSEKLGTETANGALVPVIALAGWPMKSVEMADGCTAYQLGDGLMASVTSSGQDPVCYSTDSSDVRFTFGP